MLETPLRLWSIDLRVSKYEQSELKKMMFTRYKKPPSEMKRMEVLRC